MSNMAKRTKQRPLIAKQERFCQEYTIDLNATQAAIRANYAAKTVNCFQNIGSTNLSKPMIKAEIQRLKAITRDKIGETAVKWLLRVQDTERRARIEDDYTAEAKQQDIIAKHLGFYALDNAQKADNTRIFTIKELKVLVLGADDKDKMIAQTGLSIAGEG